MMSSSLPEAVTQVDCWSHSALLQCTQPREDEDDDMGEWLRTFSVHFLRTTAFVQKYLALL